MRTVAAALMFLLPLSSAVAQRLPGTVVPEHYQLTFTPDLEQKTFAGEEVIQVLLLEPTKAITLHALEIEFLEMSVHQAGRAQEAAVSLDREAQTATLRVDEELGAGPAEIRIRYRGILNSELRGFYLSRGKGRNYAGSQMEATDARRAFPSFDEPSWKATFDITLVVDRGDTGISNGRIVSDTPGPGEGKHSLHFSTTPRLSTYLVALAVGDFQCSEGSSGGTPVRICSTPDKVHLTRYALKAAEHQVAFFSRYFGIPYPFGKLDVLALPDFEAGAMENAGAIFYRESLLLIDENTASVATRKAVAAVMSHEIAHMWFGDLVTMKWWDDIWLNEGFASWATNKPLREWKPEWNREMNDVQSTAAALGRDALVNTRQIRKQAETPSEITELFDGVAYGKAASVLRMVEAYVGEETFRRGVETYLKKFSWGNASAEDFWNTVAQVSGKPVDHIMKTYVDQPGAPLVTLAAACKDNNTVVTAAQQRFYYDADVLAKGSGELWQVPLCLRAPQGGAERCELLTQPRQEFTLPGCSFWVQANVGASGYYRTAYDAAALDGIRRSAQKDLAPGERLLLLSDEWALMRAGRRSIGDYMALLEGFRGERTRAVVAEFTGRVDYLADYLVEDSDRKAFESWVRLLLRPAAQELGWQPAPGESDELRSLRASVLQTLGYSGRDPEILAQARTLAERYVADAKAVDPTLAGTVLGLAASGGDKALHEAFLSRMEQTDEPGQRSRFMTALTLFRDPALVRRSLEYAVSGKMRNQDAPHFLADLLLNVPSRDVAWAFLKSHWPEVQATFTTSSGAAVVSATRSFCDAGSRDEAAQFFARNKVEAAERTLRRAQETINNCINLKVAQRTALAQWLAEGGKSSGGR